MNEELIVYCFKNRRGIEVEFTTLDSEVALNYAKDNGYKAFVRVYEYRRTVRLQDVKFDGRD